MAEDKTDPYEEITNRMIALIESGEISEWTNGLNGGAGVPCNALTGNPYRGINVFMAMIFGRGEVRFLTSKQAKMAGGSFVDFDRDEDLGVPMVRFGSFVPKGERGKGRGHGGKDKSVPFLRRFRVWPISCFQDLDLAKLSPEEIEASEEFSPNEKAEAILEWFHGGGGLGPEVVHGDFPHAYYAPALDRVGMPRKERYVNSARYYKTRFHEACHATGHHSRLNREPIASCLGTFGDHDYSKEELIAELGAAMLCAQAGILPEVEENAAAYMRGWLKPLKEDSRFLLQAAWAAQKAADHVAGKKWDAVGEKIAA